MTDVIRRGKLIEFKGQKKTLSQWAELVGMKAATLRARLNLGWVFDEAVSTPVRRYHVLRSCRSGEAWRLGNG